MAEEKGSAEETQIAEDEKEEKVEKVEGITPEQVQELISTKMQERDKEWQSKFDKLLNEKKETEKKSMSVEEKIEQIEKERQQERVQWARDAAKGKAQIDDELEKAIIGYNSNDTDVINESALKIKELFDGNVEKAANKMFEEDTKKRYAGRAPEKGNEQPAGQRAAMEKEYQKAIENRDAQKAFTLHERLAKMPAENN